MKKRFVLLGMLIFLLIVVVVIYNLSVLKQQETHHQIDNAQSESGLRVDESQAEVTELTDQPAEGSEEVAPTANPDETISVLLERLAPPLIDEVKKDAELDPHGTSPKLLEFANRQAELVKYAGLGEGNLSRAIETFMECSKNEQGVYPQSVVATCFVNAQKLAKRNPDKFEWQIQSLHDSLSASTRTLIRALELE